MWPLLSVRVCKCPWAPLKGPLHIIVFPITRCLYLWRTQGRGRSPGDGGRRSHRGYYARITRQRNDTRPDNITTVRERRLHSRTQIRTMTPPTSPPTQVICTNCRTARPPELDATTPRSIPTTQRTHSGATKLHSHPRCQHTHPVLVKCTDKGSPSA